MLYSEVFEIKVIRETKFMNYGFMRTVKLFKLDTTYGIKVEQMDDEGNIETVHFTTSSCEKCAIEAFKIWSQSDDEILSKL